MLMIDTQPGDILASLNRRGEVIEQLLAGETTQRELVTYLDLSRRTVGRALDTLIEEGFVRRVDGNTYRLTLFGRQIAQSHCEHMRRITRLARAASLLDRLPDVTMIDARLMDGVEIEHAPACDPDILFDAIERSIEDADSVRGIAPYSRRRYVEVFGAHVFMETEVELILERERIAQIVGNYQETWREAITQENLTVRSTETEPDYGLIIVDDELVWLGVYPENGGGLVGLLKNNSLEAVEWAIEVFASYRADANIVSPACIGSE
jgi:predicted transcriptional regulator